MNPADRRKRWLDDLETALDQAADLSARGRRAFDADPALPLAFEALATRIGEIAKRLVASDLSTFDAEVWRQAARNRDFVVHHYDRIDRGMLWRTVTVAFPALRDQVRLLRTDETSESPVSG